MRPKACTGFHLVDAILDIIGAVDILLVEPVLAGKVDRYPGINDG
jgi:hypothetical protein